VLHYLTATSKLDATIQQRAEANTKQGYQRELNYRHPDGSFSAFGTSDASGSTWLTAYVIKVFAQAGEFIFIDPLLQAKSVAWLQSKQGRDGAFISVGDVIHTEMQGGTAAGVSLTAFVLTALLQAGVHQQAGGWVTVTTAVAYLHAQRSSAPPFARSISTYALALACDTTGTMACGGLAAALDALEAAAVTVDGLTHWQTGESATPDVRFGGYGCAPASHIEISAYGLLALVAGGRVGAAFPAARWLMQQRNQYGGFASTQDTVVALEALGKYAAAVFAEAGSLSLSVSGGGLQETLVVDASNFNVLQRRDLPTAGAVTVAAAGSGLALLQLTATYNVVEEEAAAAAYTLGVSWANVSGVPGVHMTAEACVALRGGHMDPGMVLLRVRCFSGHAPTLSSLAALVGVDPVKRAEVAPDGQTAEIYLQQVCAVPLNLFTPPNPSANLC
jgi:CD109 antigen